MEISKWLKGLNRLCLLEAAKSRSNPAVTFIITEHSLLQWCSMLALEIYHPAETHLIQVIKAFKGFGLLEPGVLDLNSPGPGLSTPAPLEFN